MILRPFPVFPSKTSPFPLHFPVFSWLFNFICGKEKGEQIEICFSQLSEQKSPQIHPSQRSWPQLSWPPKKQTYRLDLPAPRTRIQSFQSPRCRTNFIHLPGAAKDWDWRGSGIRGGCSKNIFGIVKIWGSNMASSNVIDN